MQKYSQYRYALRKLSVGLTSVAVGLAFMAAKTTTVHADSEPQVQTTENQTSENKITVTENTNSKSAKIETVTPQDNTQDNKTSQTTAETKTDSDVDTTKDVNQDLKNDQNTVDNETNILKQDTNNKK